MFSLWGMRRGFTLVELLIVMVIIGILAGMLILVVGASSDKAEVAKLINNMNNVKYASLLYYANHAVCPQPGNASGWTMSLDKFLDRSLDLEEMELDIKSISGYYLIGFVATSQNAPLARVHFQQLCEAESKGSHLLNEQGKPYVAGTAKIYMVLR